MKSTFKLNIFIICVICLFSFTMSGFASSPATEEVEDAGAVCMYLNGIKAADGIKVDGTTYVPLRQFTEALVGPTETTWDAETNTATLKSEGLEIKATEGSQYFSANGRCFYAPGTVLVFDEALCVPVRELAKVFGVDVQWHEETQSVSLAIEELKLIESGDKHYNEEDLYWLSRLINSESGNQSLDGKIGVGNVVMNRVADPTCPDTIYGVIFDKKYGVQFSVIETGSIYSEPNEESIVAAKLCLDGYNNVGSSLYFVNPDIGVSSWFAKTRVFVATIGDHDFYA